MESIKAAIRSSLISFWSNKLSDVIEGSVVEEYVDEWLDSAGAAETKPKAKAAAKPKAKAAAAKPVVEAEPSSSAVKSRDELMALKLAELQKICNERGLTKSGTKQALVDRIVGVPQTLAVETKAPAKKAKAAKKPVSKEFISGSESDSESEAPAKPAKKAPKKAKAPKPIPVIETIKQAEYVLSVDKYGNYVHEETGFVFDKDNDEVIGTVDAEGNVRSLTKAQVLECRRYNFPFLMPSDIEDDDEN